MERRQRRMVQAGLALVAGLLAWQLRTEWQQANLRYDAAPTAAEPGAAMAGAVPQREPLAVEEIAAKNLFSADRNNLVTVPETDQPGPPPPVPAVVGTMKLGESYEALMSEDGPRGQGFWRVKQGEQVGAYRVVEIFAEKVVVEYEGQRTTLDIYQSARSVAQRRTRTAAPAAPAPPVVVGTGSGRPPAPAAARTPRTNQPSAPPRSREIRVPNQGPYTSVFIEGNRRRVERETPFGIQTWYEPLQPGDTE